MSVTLTGSQHGEANVPDAEIEAMGQIATALADLDDGARTRVLRWAAERYGIKILRPEGSGGRGADAAGGDDDADEPGSPDGNGGTSDRDYEHFAELYDAVAPTSDPERVLVAAYWTQVVEGKATFGSQELNKLLKQLGHGVGTVNKAMTSNMKKKPAFILQVARGGSSQQARKKYKVTDAGMKWVKGKIG
jgi:hypothetical protein